jgi:DNA-binding response OmpR family regulator
MDPKNPMNILTVDDDRITRKFIQFCLKKVPNYLVSAAENGRMGLDMIKDSPPDIVITDWTMPEMDGVTLIRNLRRLPDSEFMYVILLTSHSEPGEIVEGLNSGADDYMVKPFDQQELLARVRAGERIISAQKALRRTNEELRTALKQIRTLKDLLPICMDCKKVRNDTDYWQELDEYVKQATDTEFSHGLCPGCMEKRLAAIDRMDKKTPDPA